MHFTKQKTSLFKEQCVGILKQNLKTLARKVKPGEKLYITKWLKENMVCFLECLLINATGLSSTAEKDLWELSDLQT